MRQSIRGWGDLEKESLSYKGKIYWKTPKLVYRSYGILTSYAAGHPGLG